MTTPTAKPLELVCPAGTPAALRVAVDNGADTVYLGFRDETNARNYPGLNFSVDELADAIEYAHPRGTRILVAINTNPPANNSAPWTQAVDHAVEAGADAIILSDIGLLDYAANQHPQCRLHLSVQAFASNSAAVKFYQENFGVKRVVLPRVFTLREIARVIAETGIEVEVFAFAVAGPMAEGRCIMSSYVTGKSPNNYGACSPAHCVEYIEHPDGHLDTRLNKVLVNRFERDEATGYPTLCRGRFQVNGRPRYLFENPGSLNVISMLEQLQAIGVTAIKVEGRQRGKAYIRDVTRQFRQAIDASNNPSSPTDWRDNQIAGLCEGQESTSGAFRKHWL